MAEIGRLRLWYLLHFARPSHIRAIYRRLYAQPPRSLMELGIVPQRTLTFLRIIRHTSNGMCPRYFALDEFESAKDQHASLKTTYKMLKVFGVEPRLIPGNIGNISVSWVNQITDVDLIIVWPEVDLGDGSRARLLLPRMLSPRGEVWCQQRFRGRYRWRIITKEEIARLSETETRHRAA
ncbi:MAG: hypothetical protein ACUVQG_08180 [Thermogutta sp.]